MPTVFLLQMPSTWIELQLKRTCLAWVVVCIGKGKKNLKPGQVHLSCRVFFFLPIQWLNQAFYQHQSLHSIQTYFCFKKMFIFLRCQIMAICFCLMTQKANYCTQSILALQRANLVWLAKGVRLNETLLGWMQQFSGWGGAPWVTTS